MRLFFQTGLLLLALAAASVAQDNRATTTLSQTTMSECTEQLFEKAELSFRRRLFGGSEMLGAAERQLSEVVRLCKETSAALQVEDHLRVVHEEMAAHNLLIALFYLAKPHGRKAAALSRLKTIIERYPQYSRLDQVLFLLGKISMNDGNLDEAASYYQRIIRTYPNSQYVGDASIQLSAIELLKNVQRLDAIP